MAGFKYRLEKILNLREQELEKVKIEFQEAVNRVTDLKNKLIQNKREQFSTQKTLMTNIATPTLYTNRLKYLKQNKEELEQELIRAKEELIKAQEKLIQAQQKVEILKKHKEKKKKEYDKEELRLEEIQLNEMGLMIKRMRDDSEKEYKTDN